MEEADEYEYNRSTIKRIWSILQAAAAEGAVLLKNEASHVPVEKEEMVSVFGRCQFETYRSGTGSGGAVNVPYAVNIYDGMRESGSFTLNEELADIYRAWLKTTRLTTAVEAGQQSRGTRKRW